MNCKNCGLPLNGNQVCPSCGTINELNNNVQPEQVVQENTTVEQSPVVPEAPIIEQSIQPSATSVQPTINVESTNQAPKKKNVGLIIALAVGGGLLVLIGVICIIVFSIRGAFKKAVNNTYKPGTNTSTSSTESNKRTVSNDTESPYKTRKSKTNPVVKIDLTGMTGEEIVANCLDAVEISNGDKAYDYTDRFKYESPNYILLNKEHKVGLSGNWSWKDASKDAFISHVAFFSISEKDDGTLVLKKDPIVQISLNFKTYEQGKETLEAFDKEFKKIGETTRKQTEGERESTNIKYGDYDYYVSLVYPEKEGRNYEMFAWIPVAFYMQVK